MRLCRVRRMRSEGWSGVVQNQDSLGLDSVALTGLDSTAQRRAPGARSKIFRPKESRAACAARPDRHRVTKMRPMRPRASAAAAATQTATSACRPATARGFAIAGFFKSASCAVAPSDRPSRTALRVINIEGSNLYSSAASVQSIRSGGDARIASRTLEMPQSEAITHKRAVQPAATIALRLSRACAVPVSAASRLYITRSSTGAVRPSC